MSVAVGVGDAADAHTSCWLRRRGCSMAAAQGPSEGEGPSLIRMEKAPDAQRPGRGMVTRRSESRDVSWVSSSCQYLLHKYW